MRRLAGVVLAVVWVAACGNDGDVNGTVATGEDSGTQTSSTSGDPCPVGAELCMCTEGGACDAGLSCVQGICIQNGETSSPTSADTTSADATTTFATDDSATDEGVDSETGTREELDDWTRRRPITVTNPNDADMIDHQVMIDIDWDDDMAPNLVDLRFTDERGEILPHWIESTLAPVSARVWVRVPLVPAGDEATIFMWYGNPDASDGADPDAVFDLWEDCDDMLDETVWSTTAGYEVTNGHLRITNGALYSNVPLVTLPGLLVEIRARFPGSGGAGAGLTVAESQGAIGAQDIMSITQTPLHYVAANGGNTLANENWTNPPGAATASFEWYGVGMGAGVVRFSRTHDYDPNFVWWHDIVAEFPNEFYLGLGHGWGSLAGREAIFETEIDILLARKFAALPAGTSVGSEEDV